MTKKKSILQTINDHNNRLSLDISKKDTYLMDNDTIPCIQSSLSEVTLRDCKFGQWWKHIPSSYKYQIRRLPQSMDKLNDISEGLVLWHRDLKIAIHLPVEISSEWEYLGEGHDAPNLQVIVNGKNS